ncbi:MAG: NAD(P)H-dependent oxidoreductase subunit E [Phycisphaeraceae bacterium]|nr:NAD(P)H-dependent oxidoreductase subunit E [Phycisphaeraceae bacterium]
MKTEEAAPDLTVILRKWARKRGNLIMILHELQNHHGYVARSIALTLARELNVPLARIYEVLTFYNYFKLKPPGRHVTSVCMGTACYLKGAGDVFGELSQRLKVEDGQTTEDGEYHLQTVRCLGCCGLAPVVMINGRIHSKVQPRDVSRILEQTVPLTTE